MKKLVLITIFTIFLSSCASTPKLYSAVLPMEDGSLFTSTTANSKDKSLIRATRNAERYCLHKNQFYSVITVETIYEGVLADEETANKAEKGANILNKLTFGVLSPGTATDYRVNLAFRCNDS